MAPDAPTASRRGARLAEPPPGATPKQKRAPLTLRQAKFVSEYVRDMNGTQAAIRAGYSPRNAPTAASLLLNMPKVSDRIRAEQDRQLKRISIDGERAKRETAILAFYDPSELFDDNGKLRQWSQIPAELKHAVVSISYYPDGSIRHIRLQPRVEPLRLIWEHLGLLDVDEKARTAEGWARIPLEVVRAMIGEERFAAALKLDEQHQRAEADGKRPAAALPAPAKEQPDAQGQRPAQPVAAPPQRIHVNDIPPEWRR